MKTIEERFDNAQAELIESFKVKMLDVAKSVLSTVYTDVANYASTDAHVNYHNFLRDEFKASFVKEISTEYGHYSWAHGIRMTLLKEYPDVLRNKIITDLEEKIKALEESNDQLRRFR